MPKYGKVVVITAGYLWEILVTNQSQQLGRIQLPLFLEHLEDPVNLKYSFSDQQKVGGYCGSCLPRGVRCCGGGSRYLSQEELPNEAGVPWLQSYVGECGRRKARL